jgi:3-phenylpropionate/trans-cinnamate dioxygenase ferredoxin subunit
VSEQASFVAVVPLDDLRPGYATTHLVEGLEIVITLTDDGEPRAWDAQCPHADFQLVPSRLKRGCELECPMHGARFDARDGSVTKGPAKDPLVPIEVRVDDGVVMVLADWL